MRTLPQRLWYDDSGQDLIEYALLVAVVTTAAVALLPNTIHGAFYNVMSRCTSLLERFGTGGG
jgi:Flp pilus assembly pilin Flp